MALPFHQIESPESMSSAIRQVSIIPFVRNTVPGWSIEELTAPGCWFMDDGTDGVLGPWDWKIVVVAEGNIAYGKFIRNKAEFATVEWYAHLMNWRRSQPKYRMAIGEEYDGNTMMEGLYRTLSPTLLSAIKELGCIEGSDVKKILTARTSPELHGQIKGSLEKYMMPEVKKQAADFLNQYLEMGTWTVIGSFSRVYRGEFREYKGWQKSSITTPDDLFGYLGVEAEELSWNGFLECKPRSILPDCSPEESRDAIIGQILENFPESDKKELLKLI